MPGQIAPEDTALMLRPWPSGPAQRTTLSPTCGMYEPAWSPDGQQVLYGEQCNNLNNQRAAHLVVTPRDQPLNREVVCDGLALSKPDWGKQGQVLATTNGYDENTLVVCDISDMLADT